jgi:hypothetical protein
MVSSLGYIEIISAVQNKSSSHTVPSASPPISGPPSGASPFQILLRRVTQPGVCVSPIRQQHRRHITSLGATSILWDQGGSLTRHPTLAIQLRGNRFPRTSESTPQHKKWSFPVCVCVRDCVRIPRRPPPRCSEVTLLCYSDSLRSN